MCISLHICNCVSYDCTYNTKLQIKTLVCNIIVLNAAVTTLVSLLMMVIKEFGRYFYLGY